MRQTDILELAGFNYWANHRLLEVCEQLTPDQWTSTDTVGDRTLRGVLVHTFDTEWSWRVRLQGPEAGEDDEELSEDNYPTVAGLSEAWAADEAAMMTWLNSLSDDDLAGSVPVPWGREYILWRLIVHVFTHSIQQRAEAAALLTRAGHSPGDIEFLNYISRSP